MNRLADFRRKADTLIAEREHARRRVIDEKKALRTAQQRLEDVEAAQKALQQIAQQVQQEAHEKLSAVVGRCLESVFGDAYGFLIDFQRKRGKTEARLCFTRDGKIMDDPTYDACGGAVDVAALALRLACLMLAKPRRRRLLVMDEPLRNLNGIIHQEKVAELIETLAEEMQVQFVIASDDDWLRIGNVIELG